MTMAVGVLYMTIAVGDAGTTGLWRLCCCVKEGGEERGCAEQKQAEQPGK